MAPRTSSTARHPAPSRSPATALAKAATTTDPVSSTAAAAIPGLATSTTPATATATATATELPERLPLIPETILRRHHAHAPNDTRFRACARLLQSLHRERLKLPIGSFTAPSAKRPRKQGNLLNQLGASAGGNFLNHDIHRLVRRELAYREPGASIDVDRLYANLLSSMPLAWNLFGFLKLNRSVAKAWVATLLPYFAGEIAHIQFEHSPGRGDPSFTDDGSAFDAMITVRTTTGARAFLAFEVKYSETMSEPEARLRDRYNQLAADSGLFLDPASPELRRNPLQQLWREHMLAQAMVSNGLYDRGAFIVLAPKDNTQVQRGATLYNQHLRTPTADQVPFLNIHLEDAFQALAAAGAPDAAQALHSRYTDFTPVHALFAQ